MVWYPRFFRSRLGGSLCNGDKKKLGEGGGGCPICPILRLASSCVFQEWEREEREIACVSSLRPGICSVTAQWSWCTLRRVGWVEGGERVLDQWVLEKLVSLGGDVICLEMGSGLEVKWTNEMGEWERGIVREDSGVDVFLGETLNDIRVDSVLRGKWRGWCNRGGIFGCLTYWVKKEQWKLEDEKLVQVWVEWKKKTMVVGSKKKLRW